MLARGDFSSNTSLAVFIFLITNTIVAVASVRLVARTYVCFFVFKNYVVKTVLLAAIVLVLNTFLAIFVFPFVKIII